METPLAEKLAREYVRLVDEGWSPDVDEFVGRIPKDLQAPCRDRIAELMAIAEEVVQEEVVQEYIAPEPAGPQLLSKEEAMAMWASQNARV